MVIPTPRRSALAVLPLAAVFACLVTAPAGAVVTTSAITSTVPLHDQGNYDLPPNDPANARTLSGTSDGAAGDGIRLVCRRSPTQTAPLTTSTVAADGTFTISYGADDIAGRRCRLAAIPTGADPATVDLTPFTGPVVYGGALQHVNYATGANTGVAHDFYWESGRPGIYNDYDSIGNCGLCDTRLRAEDGTEGTKYLWYDNAAAYKSHTAEGTPRPYVKVDGNPAYFPDVAASVVPGGPTGIPAAATTATLDPVSGDVTIVSDEQPTSCGTFPATAMSCSAFTSVGVAVKRTIVEDEGGFRVRITDEWRSTDGLPHAVDVDMDEYIQSNDAGLRFPGDADFTAKGPSGTTRTGFSGITTIAFKSNRAAPASLNEPIGSLTVLPAPTQGLFANASSGLLLRHVIDVPATGVATIKRIYVIAASDAGLDAPTLRARDLIEGPSVTLDALPATVTSATLKVTGAATDAVGVASVTVNGGAAALADTAYSRQVTLAPGANAITVVATDGAGNIATTTGTVTYVPPPVVIPPVVKPPVVTPPVAKAPTISRSGKAGAKTTKGVTTVSLGRKVTCPAGTTTCRTTITLKVAGKSIGTVKVSTKAGRSTVLKVKLSKAAAKALKRAGKLKLAVKITAAAGTKTTTKALTLTLRR